MANEQSQNGSGEYQTDEISYVKGGLLLMVESQIWTLINNFVIVLVFAKCFKLITLEENIISLQQLPLCLPLLFPFSSEVLNSGIKSCFDGVVFQDAVYEECFSIRLWCLHLWFLLLFL